MAYQPKRKKGKGFPPGPAPKSGIKGLRQTSTGKWSVRYCKYCKSLGRQVGTFPDMESAKAAYARAEQGHFELRHDGRIRLLKRLGAPECRALLLALDQMRWCDIVIPPDVEQHTRPLFKSIVEKLNLRSGRLLGGRR